RIENPGLYFLHGQAARKASRAKAINPSCSFAGWLSMYCTTTRTACSFVPVSGAHTPGAVYTSALTVPAQ
ncbi:MAG: hypothetical protein WCD13_24105, partial [Pseudolabrys sp.]